MPAEHVDVLIVGAGLSGVGAACHLQDRCPGKTVAILEARGAIGGTWDLFRYPGVRSDSDMFTLGYSFRPWPEAKAIADGGAILDYVRDTAAELGVDRLVRFHPLTTVMALTWMDAFSALRTLIEPEIAALATPKLNAEDLAELEALIDHCKVPPQSFEERIAQRIAELEFHVVLARRCDSAMLTFIGRFLNDMIRDLVIFKKSALPEQHEFSCANLNYHQQLLEAFHARDAERARRLMHEHMRSAEHFNKELEGQLEQHFLTPQ